MSNVCDTLGIAISSIKKQGQYSYFLEDILENE
jgi:hypothetical protein